MRWSCSGLATPLLLAASVAGRATEPLEIHIPGTEPPAVLQRLESTAGLTALAVSPDLHWLAVAFLDDEQVERSSLRLYAAQGEPSRVEVVGRIRDLLFSSDQNRVYGLLHRGAKKGPGETQLVVYEVERARLRRAVRVPASARSLDHWTARGALLIAGDNEIRTLTLPDLRSGPLFRVLGVNLAVTSIAGGDLLLVGQEDALVLLGLSDPPGQYEMPIRARVAAPGPVVALASSPDGAEVLARVADGTLYGVTLTPLRLHERGTTAFLASLEGHDEVPPPDSPAEVTPPPRGPTPPPVEPPASPPVAAQAAPDPAPAPPVPSSAAAADASVAAGRTATDESTRRAPTDTAQADTGSDVVAEERAATDEPTPSAPTDAAQADAGPVGAESGTPVADASQPASLLGGESGSARLRGRIVGPAAGSVVAVVLLGPDNLLRLAARVVPGPDGRWEVDGLAPGRYRVQLDGGGGRVLVSRPAFLLLEIEAERSLESPEFEVLRTL